MQQQSCGALFIDVENWVVCSREAGLPLELDYLIERLVEDGPLYIRKAYGDLERSRGVDMSLPNSAKERRAIRLNMQKNVVQFEDMPYNGDKNSADMRMALQMQRIMFTNPHIDTFYILSGDFDFAQLVNELHQEGKRVVGIGVSPQSVKNTLPFAYDKFIYLCNLTEAASKGEVKDDYLMEQYAKLMERVIKDLFSEDIAASCERVLSSMRKRNPALDFRMVGCKNYEDFLHHLQQQAWIKLHHLGDSQRIEWIGPKAPLSATEQKEQNYRLLIQTLLKMELPSAQVRAQVFQQLPQLDLFATPDSRYSIVELVDLIQPHVSVAKNVVNTLIYHLVKARLFNVEYAPNLQVTGFAQSELQLSKIEQIFTKYITKELKKRESQLDQSILTKIFESAQ